MSHKMSKPVELKEEHVFEFSKKIVTETDLNEFGIKVLHVPQHVVEAAIDNRPLDIQTASHNVFKAWMKMQKNREIAYKDLTKNLEISDFRNLTNDLKQIVEGEQKNKGEAKPVMFKDQHVWEFSKLIATEQNLYEFGIKVLDMRRHVVDSAKTNHPRDIKTAAYDVFKDWVAEQEHQEETLQNLIKNLQKSKLRSLINDLKEIVKEQQNNHQEEEQVDDDKETVPMRNEGATCSKKILALSVMVLLFGIILGIYWSQGLQSTSYSSQALLRDPNEVRALIKRSLQKNWGNSLSHDWIPRVKAKTFPLKDFYVELKWSRKVKGAIKDKKVPISGLHELFDQCNGACHFLVEGEPGVGKTTALASLALDWSRIEELTRKQTAFLKKIDYVFLILLRYVDQTSTLAEVIIKQHQKLEDVDPHFIASILKGKGNFSVLLLIDGYDEYTPGTNKDIDKLIQNGVGKCFVIITSRPGFLNEEIKYMFNGEITIEGLSESNIRKCTEKYLQSKEKSNSLLKQAKDIEINDLLRVPITLLMICVVFDEKNELPKRKTELVGTIFKLSIDRTTLKLLNKTSQNVENIDTMLHTLGKFSWQSLQNNVKQLLLNKDELDMVSPIIAKLGLLSETGTDVAGVHEQPKYVTFAHKMIHEFSAAMFVANSLEQASNVTVLVRQYFPTEMSIVRNEEVIMFVCGLLSDCSYLMAYLYNVWIEIVRNTLTFTKINQHRFGLERLKIKNIDTALISYPIYKDQLVLHPFFERLYMESQITFPGQFNHNQFINDEDASRPIYFPSKLYWFSLPGDKLYLGLKRHNDITEASFIISRTIQESMTNIWSICCTISQSQPANHILLHFTKFPLLTEPCSLRLSPNITSFSILSSYVPPYILFNLLEQLSATSQLHFMCLYDTSLGGINYLILNNKVNTLTQLVLADVVMDKKLCDNILRQVMLLNNLVTLEVFLELDTIATVFYEVKIGYGVFCEIDKLLCPEFLTAISTFSHLEHLDLSGNNLTGCLSNFIPQSYPGLPSLEKLYLSNTKLNSDDLVHLANMIQEVKVPNLKQINLNYNNFHGIEDKVFHLINVCVVHHQTELNLRLLGTNIQEKLISKWQSQCEGTHVKINKKITKFR